MKKYLKIDKAIYEVDEQAKTYKFLKRNFNWDKLSEEENRSNKKFIEGYMRIMDTKAVENIDRKSLLQNLLEKNINELISNLASENANLKFTSSKALIQISEDNPEKIYPNLQDFVALFENENNIIKWTGIIIIGNLAKVDKGKKIDKIMPKLFQLLNNGKMITAGNATEALAKIALAKPELQGKITSELLKVEKYQYDTKECNNIACGHVINAFILYLKKPDKKVIKFLERQTKNSRRATAEKANNYLNKLM